MKTWASILFATVLTFGIASAQDTSGNANQSVAGTRAGTDLTGFTAPKTLGPTSTTVPQAPNLHPDLKPQLGGIFVDGGKYGTQLINPAAPASYGMGEKYLSAPDPRYDVERQSGPSAHRDAGGFKLFSLEF